MIISVKRQTKSMRSMKAAFKPLPSLPRLPAGQDPVKREQIIDGAARVFSTMGYDTATVRDIAREAGVSKGTIYVYFHNKEELFIELINSYGKKLLGNIYSSLLDHRVPRETLVAFGEALLFKLTSDTVIRAHRVIIGVAQRMPTLSQSFYDQASKRGLSLLMAYFDKEVSKGTLLIEDSTLAAYQFTDLIGSGLFKQRLYGCMEENPTQEQIRAAVAAGVELFLEAYGKR